MNHNIKFRTLYAHEIEVRPSHIKDGKANLLLYIDSRAVVSLLDETIGNLNWQSEFYEVNGQTIGKIGIYNEERGLWVWKSDTGSESNIEAEKGLISDIYKRVLSRWGVSELYSAPKIAVADDGYGCSGYKVSEILYNEHREIIHLVISNRYGKEVFKWQKEVGEERDKSSIPSSSPVMETVNINESIIQSIKDKANQLYYQQGINQEELRKFVNFYTSKIDKDGWRGTFNFDTLFSRWMDKVRS